MGGETAGERGVGRERKGARERKRQRQRETERDRDRETERKQQQQNLFFNKDAAKHATVKTTSGHGDGVWTPTPTSNGSSLIILTQSSS